MKEDFFFFIIPKDVDEYKSLQGFQRLTKRLSQKSVALNYEVLSGLITLNNLILVDLETFSQPVEQMDSDAK